MPIAAWFLSIIYSLIAGLAAGMPHDPDYVRGELITINNNGHWSWFMDERVIVDQETETILTGSVANMEGEDGAARNGNVEVSSYAPPTGEIRLTTLHEHLEADDHDAPALLVRPDGRYVAVYTKHNKDRFTRWRISIDPHDLTGWSDEKLFDWGRPPAPIGKDKVTYSNVFYLRAEGRTYNFARSLNRDPTFMVSGDDASTWAFGGKLLTDKRIGYVNAYVKYASNGEDRIDFIATEHHPRDFSNSIYHGYIQGGKTHRSDGKVVDDSIFDSVAPRPGVLTKVFATGTLLNGEVITRCWTTDLAVSPERHIYGVFSCRANDVPDNTNFNDHRFFYARLVGSTWSVHQLAKAGQRLWNYEEDYVGGAAVDPQDPNTVYISTPIDPRQGMPLAKHEIFKGVTSDSGKTWSWEPITFGSSVDNLRPVVPQWNSDRVAILWCRGIVRSSQNYNTRIVGIIERRN
jgi:hypothetical protein